jgi:hypothetical protein
MLHQHEIFGERIQKGKEMVRTGQDRALPLFYPSWERAFKGGYKTETRYSNARLSLYGMGDAPAIVIKGDAPLATCVSFTCIIEDGQ